MIDPETTRAAHRAATAQRRGARLAGTVIGVLLLLIVAGFGAFALVLAPEGTPAGPIWAGAFATIGAEVLAIAVMLLVAAWRRPTAQDGDRP